MTIRDWVLEKLGESTDFSGISKISAEILGENGVKVQRNGRPDAVAYCAEPDSSKPFSIEDLNNALIELPQTQMIIVTRRSVAPGVYARAGEVGVCVDTFGGFTTALLRFDDISQYVHSEETYVRKRLARTRVVTSVTRVGHRAWFLTRRNGLRPLTIVTLDRYELTDDGFGAAVDKYPEIQPDAIVVTNPSAQGFGDRVINSSKQAGIPLFKIDDFVSKIHESWT